MGNNTLLIVKILTIRVLELTPELAVKAVFGVPLKLLKFLGSVMYDMELYHNFKLCETVLFCLIIAIVITGYILFATLVDVV